MRALLPALGRIDMALVGEPTGMQAAAGERGLVVLDCTAHGKSGHAARGEGVNALYIALEDIARLRSFRFERESELLGPVGIAVTQIEAGTQHNVVPDTWPLRSRTSARRTPTPTRRRSKSCGRPSGRTPCPVRRASGPRRSERNIR